MNKIERVNAILRGEKADCVPAGFWYHYKGDELGVEAMIDAHVRTYRETDADIMKVMQDYIVRMEGKMKTPDDWAHVRYPGVESAVYQKLADVLKGILDRLGGETLVFQTLFGPFKNAVFAWGDELVMAHAKAAPEKVAAGVRSIAESMAEWVAGFMDIGMAGLYYTAQFTEPGRFTKAEWERVVRPADLIVLKAAEEKGGRNILHICGEPEYNFAANPAWTVDYPCAIVNWSVKDTGLSLAEGRKLFNKPLLGGMNNKGNILTGPASSIAAEARAVIEAAKDGNEIGGIAGFMLGADCTIQGQGIRNDYIRAAVDTAHSVHA